MAHMMTVRDKAMLALGVNTGFRISELLSLRRGDVIHADGKIVRRVVVQRRHMKGKKRSREILLNTSARMAILDLMRDMDAGGYVRACDWLFRSRRGDRHISRVQAYRILHKAAVAAGVRTRVGTHTMRKTFANRIYDHFLAKLAAGEPVDAFRQTSKALGHAGLNNTERYLSFLDSDTDHAVEAIGDE